jgi:hypothetical protein
MVMKPLADAWLCMVMKPLADAWLCMVMHGYEATSRCMVMHGYEAAVAAGLPEKLHEAIPRIHICVVEAQVTLRIG